MTTEEQFQAAVNVIRNLPKNGAYQPSNEIMLRFYAYYKQATEGPCQQPKPAFWEVVKKAKWDAWTRLGNMSRTEAMNNYVEELKKIVETMSYTDKVANFLDSLDSFCESVPPEDLELLLGPVLERMRSQPGMPLSGSPLASRETSPHRVCNITRHIASSLETSPATSHGTSPPDTDGEEEFIDTVESAPERIQKDTTKTSNVIQKMTNGLNISTEKINELIPQKENSSELINGYTNTNGYTEPLIENKQERNKQRIKKDEKSNDEFFNQIATTMQNLQRDLDRITTRVRSLEGQTLQALAPSIIHKQPTSYPKWWPLPECSPRLFTILIIWPFITQFLISLIQRYRQRRL
ncbi:acyl-CoA-binding domain-containing protein 4 isoform X1 [Apis florea]|uniref:acyl-CoA-binding domain-containing protein 4 isoform X1 n=2 Tax=Apis florea TaxID=7463 RepID=UPI000252B7E4|nr:acyl-CoA-binding domain-containing protein 4 isoform X1 [Apis florea]XP_012343033.1 acyl-CoA-binding domain-containing protein 4 isoform X1 [Apis florea]XP_012343034.1 acyl-CoA-binding domain-containing protein 4 isoform X1 [Apis florea]